MAYSSVIRLNKAFVFAALLAMAMVEAAEGLTVNFSMAASNVPQFEYMHGASTSGVNLYYTPPTNGTFVFGLFVPKGGWVSLGWSADCNMYEADVVIAGVSEPTAAPGTFRTSARPGRTLLPDAALAKEINLRHAWDPAEAFLTVHRSKEGGNVPLNGTSICVIWAYSNSSLPTYHGPDRRGGFRIALAEPAAAEASVSAEGEALGSKPAEGEGAMPAEGSVPAEGEGSMPAGEGSKPAEGEGSLPAEGEGSKPAEGEGSMPTEGEGSTPAEEGSKPAEGAEGAETGAEAGRGEGPAAEGEGNAEASASGPSEVDAKSEGEASESAPNPGTENEKVAKSPTMPRNGQNAPSSAPLSGSGSTKREPNAAASISVALLVALLTFSAYLVV